MMENKRAFKWVMGSHYFLYFGMMGIFLPYFNLYCFHLGFDGFQIGSISAVRSFAMILFPILWSMAADRFEARRPIFIFCNILAVISWSAFLFTGEYRYFLLITAVYGIFYAPVISFMEAFTMDGLGDEKSSYGRIRAWGTVSFIFISGLMGKIIDLSSVSIIIGIILGGSLIQALLSVAVPEIRGRKKQYGNAAFLKKPQTIIFLFCAFLMLASHGAYYGFFSIHLETLGFGKSFIGIAWALASVAEIVVMLSSARIFRRFAIEDLLFFSFLIAALRWLILSFSTSPVIILASQMLHALTYATFHIASILHMDRISPQESKTLGQSVNNAMTYGLGLMIGFFFNGYLYEKTGSFHLFAISSIIALAGALILKISHIYSK
ncbi:MAG: MFS transporter [Desulfococcaceae bacterium]|nr:MFS transporter [Desulfococcaceae bacterium]